MQAEKPRRTGGRPKRHEAGLIDEKLLACASKLFLTHGYGAVSIEAVVKAAGISKRTFYDRYDGKPELFAAVVKNLIDHMRPKGKVHLFDGGSLKDILLTLAQIMLRATLSKDGLAMQRIMLAEAARFPEVALISEKQGARQEAVNLISQLLMKEMAAGNITVNDPVFAAEQFISLVISVPQRRGLGLGHAMTAKEIEAWGQDAVAFFLQACQKKR